MIASNPANNVIEVEGVRYFILGRGDRYQRRDVLYYGDKIMPAAWPDTMYGTYIGEMFFGYILRPVSPAGEEREVKPVHTRSMGEGRTINDVETFGHPTTGSRLHNVKGIDPKPTLTIYGPDMSEP